MIIDIHEHAYSGITTFFPGTEKRFIMVKELVEIMDKKSIDASVILPITTPDSVYEVQGVRDLYETCDLFPNRFIKFCNVDPRANNNKDINFTPLLEDYKKLGAKGLGEITANLRWNDPRVQNLLRDCEATELPIIFHLATRDNNTYGLITQPGMPELEEALQRYPNLQFLGHSQAFWAEVGESPSEDDRNGYPHGEVKGKGRIPELMRRYSNLWGDLSAGSGYNAIQRDPEWGYAFLEEFSNRLLMGLDLCFADSTAFGILDLLSEGVAKQKISSTTFKKIMGGNAIKLLNL
ncbi:MAG: amidohydrolase family protein [Candidatus Ratteibacteria bacterium]|jgi:predicted TIM-barrel fold metal-dependent hydrolase